MKTIVIPLNNIYSFSILLSALSFLIPFVGLPNQLVIGTLINAMLFSAAKTKSNVTLLPLYILPSLGSVARGLVFGPNTIFLYYFLPFIWIGNATLVSVFRFFLKSTPILSSVIAAFAKFLILQLAAYLLYWNNLVPKQFLTQMGVFQLITALLGAGVVLLIQQYERK